MFWQFLRLLVFVAIVTVIYLWEISLFLDFIISKIKRQQSSNKPLAKSVIFIHFLAVIGLACFLYGYFIEPYRLKITTVNIATEKFKHTNLRIVQVSDLHCDTKIRNEPKLISMVNALNPDIIVFTGDALNTPDALSQFKETMRRLRSRLGKYAARGNMDVAYWHDLDLFDDTGFVELTKKSIRLVKEGETFYISGLTYKYFHDWRNLLNKVPAGSYSIFLHHTPDLIEEIKETSPIRDSKTSNGVNVDLYIAGHTHGGQVSLPFFGALLTLSRHGKKYEAGKYVVNRTILYVNRGIGMEGGFIPRVRFFSRPEITVFNIKPKND
jgi:predicted MPP superfamily phosphohydrolase